MAHLSPPLKPRTPEQGADLRIFLQSQCQPTRPSFTLLLKPFGPEQLILQIPTALPIFGVTPGRSAPLTIALACEKDAATVSNAAAPYVNPDPPREVPSSSDEVPQPDISVQVLQPTSVARGEVLQTAPTDPGGFLSEKDLFCNRFFDLFPSKSQVHKIVCLQAKCNETMMVQKLVLQPVGHHNTLHVNIAKQLGTPTAAANSLSRPKVANIPSRRRAAPQTFLTCNRDHRWWLDEDNRKSRRPPEAGVT